jgi:glucokinase
MLGDNSTRGRDFVLAIDFGGTKVDLATADTQGTLLHTTRLDTNAVQGARYVLERTMARARQLVRRTETERSGHVLAVGAASPGVILSDRVLLAPNIPGWDQLALGRVVSKQLEIDTVAVANDVRAGALAEVHWGALRGANPAVYLSLGTGISAAVVVDGRPLAGAHNAAGEIGYSLRNRADDLGAAHGRAPLEEYAGGRALGERASQVAGVSLSAAEAFEHADPAVQSLVDEALDEVAVRVANMCIVVDPECVAIGGGLAASGERVVRAIKRRVKLAVPFPPRVVLARFVRDASLRGAVLLAVQAANGHVTIARA